MTSALPEDLRPFWLAYLSELLDRIYTREWIVASYQVGIDYMMNYTLSMENLANWPGEILIVESDDEFSICLEQLKLFKAMYPQTQAYRRACASHHL